VDIAFGAGSIAFSLAAAEGVKIAVGEFTANPYALAIASAVGSVLGGLAFYFGLEMLTFNDGSVTGIVKEFLYEQAGGV
jgi:hypothetical protein